MRAPLVLALLSITSCVDTTLPDLASHATLVAPTVNATPTEPEPEPEPECRTPGAACDDHNPCTESDSCDEGLGCLGTLRDCDDDIPCTLERCHPATGDCEYDTWGCDCVEWEDCDDGNPCTLDACDVDLSGCYHEVADTEDCDDGDPCTVGSWCQPDGSCGGGEGAAEDGDECLE